MTYIDYANVQSVVSTAPTNRSDQQRCAPASDARQQVAGRVPAENAVRNRVETVAGAERP